MKQIDARRQKRFDKKDEHKKLIGLWNKQSRLWAASRNYNWIEYPKPIRKGYVRFMVLREDIAKSREAHIYKPLLKFINSKDFSRTKKFMYKPRGSKVKRAVQIETKSIDHYDWQKKVEPHLTLKQKSLFEKRWHNPSRFRGRVIGSGQWKYHFLKPWMFVPKVEPYYVTHYLEVNPQLESETQELWNKIYVNNLWPKIDKARSKAYGKRYDDDWNAVRSRLMKSYLDKEQKTETTDRQLDPLGEDWYD